MITKCIYESFGRGWTGVNTRGPHWKRMILPEGIAYFCYDRPVSAFDPPDLPPARIVDILWIPHRRIRRKPN